MTLFIDFPYSDTLYWKFKGSGQIGHVPQLYKSQNTITTFLAPVEVLNRSFCPRNRATRDTRGEVFLGPMANRLRAVARASTQANSSFRGWDGAAQSKRAKEEASNSFLDIAGARWGRTWSPAKGIYPISLEWDIGPGDAADIACTCLHASKSACSPAFHQRGRGALKGPVLGLSGPYRVGGAPPWKWGKGAGNWNPNPSRDLHWARGP